MPSFQESKSAVLAAVRSGIRANLTEQAIKALVRRQCGRLGATAQELVVKRIGHSVLVSVSVVYESCAMHSVSVELTPTRYRIRRAA